MASPTTRGKYKKQALGEGLNTWGLTSGLNGLFDVMDEALHGVNEITLTGTAYTLTSTNYTTNDIRFRQFKFTGNFAATITIPATQNWWIIENATGQTLTFDNGSNTATLANTFYGLLTTNGTTVSMLTLPDGTNVATVANAIASVNTVAGDINSVIAVAGKSTEVGRLGTTAAVADLAALGGTTEVASLNALSPRAADLQALAPRESDLNTLSPRASDLQALSPRASDLQALSPRASDLQALAPRESDLNTLSPRASDLQTLSPRASDIGTLADVEDGTTATNALSTLAPRSSDMQTLAPRASDMQTLSSISSAISGVNAIASDVSAVNTNPLKQSILDVDANATNINSVAGLSAAITGVNAIASDVTAVNTNPLKQSILDVDSNSTNINNVGGSITSINTVANNLSDVNAFGNTYQISTNNPTLDGGGNALSSGDLAYVTSASKLRVYNGSSWEDAGSATNGTVDRHSYVATANQTTFPATGSISYNPNFVDVYLNGVKLVNGTDVTVTSGTDIVLAAGAAVNDTVDVVAYGTFALADMYTKAQSDNRYVQPSGNVATATTATNVAGGSANGILYQSATSTTAHLSAGTAGTVLQSNGAGSAPAWVATSTIATPTGVASVMKFS